MTKKMWKKYYYKHEQLLQKCSYYIMLAQASEYTWLTRKLCSNGDGTIFLITSINPGSRGEDITTQLSWVLSFALSTSRWVNPCVLRVIEGSEDTTLVQTKGDSRVISYLGRVAFRIPSGIHDGAPSRKQPTASTNWLFSQKRSHHRCMAGYLLDLFGGRGEKEWKCRSNLDENLDVVSRGVFRTQLNIYDGTFFSDSSQQMKPEKAPS